MLTLQFVQTTVPHGGACCGCLDIYLYGAAVLLICNECGREVGRGNLVSAQAWREAIEERRNRDGDAV